MSEESIKRYKRNYIRELMTYTFSEEYYHYITSNNPKYKLSINERRNRNIIRNTPKLFYLFAGKFICYDRLRKVNEHINEWIDIFTEKVKFVDDVSLIDSVYREILDYINREISMFIEESKRDYGITYPIIADTLVKNYLDILIARRHKIAITLRNILQSEFNLYYEDFSREIWDLYNYYQGKILSIEDESIELYNKFRNDINDIVNRPIILMRRNEGGRNNGN